LDLINSFPLTTGFAAGRIPKERRNAVWTGEIDGFTVVWSDVNSNLAVDTNDTIETTLKLELQSATLTAYTKNLISTGFTDAYFSMSIPVAIGTLTAKLDYSGTPLAMDYYFKLSSNVAGLGFDIWTRFTMTGMDSAEITLSVPFSL
jgi:hypothetical protein